MIVAIESRKYRQGVLCRKIGRAHRDDKAHHVRFGGEADDLVTGKAGSPCKPGDEKGQTVFHRMGNGDPGLCSLLEQTGETVRLARHAGAFAVVDIVGRAAARRPGEQHRRSAVIRIMRDLRRAVDGIVEGGVVAMDEDHGAPAARRDVGAERTREIGLRLVGDDVGGGEELQRVVGLAGLVALDLAGLVDLRDGDVDACEVEHRGARIVEYLAGVLGVVAGGGDEDAVVAGDLGRRDLHRRGSQHVGLWLRDAARDQQYQQYDDEPVLQHS